MRMLYWRVFLATSAACQTGLLNSCVNMIYHGIQCYHLCHKFVSKKFHEISGCGLETVRKIALER
jgi:hypothetical protein